MRILHPRAYTDVSSTRRALPTGGPPLPCVSIRNVGTCAPTAAVMRGASAARTKARTAASEPWRRVSVRRNEST